MYDRASEIGQEKAAKIARKELGVEDPKKKKKDWDVVRRTTPLGVTSMRETSTPASPCDSGNGSGGASASAGNGGDSSWRRKKETCAYPFINKVDVSWLGLGTKTTSVFLNTTYTRKKLVPRRALGYRSG